MRAALLDPVDLEGVFIHESVYKYRFNCIFAYDNALLQLENLISRID